MITIRLDPTLEQAVNNTAKNLNLTKSDLIRKSLIAYLEKFGNQGAWESGKELFGKYYSDYSNLSTDRKAILKDKIKAKRK